MNAYIFTGPSLSTDEAYKELDAIYLPPASEGDVYRVACRKPRAIGIIDGYFECVPAVWHKEILWAMAQGVHVYGSASIGALRAAELAMFGMEGVGKIYEAYRDGRLEDDDEVAVTHSSAGRGYQPHSVAMVNIRATLDAAEKAGVIHRVARKRLQRIAKELFYQERSYPAVLQRAGQTGVSLAQLDALRRWLPAGEIDQKREDALDMLRVIRAQLNGGLTPKCVAYSFEYTANWEMARRRAGSLEIDSSRRADTFFAERLVDELRLEGETYSRSRHEALFRFLALNESWRQGMVPTTHMACSAMERFRREEGIEDQEGFGRWLNENHLSHEEFLELMEDQARLEWVQNLAEVEAATHVLDYLRMAGHYSRVAKRARDKQRALESEGLQNPSPLDTGLTEHELLRWYFEERLNHPIPTDLADYCHRTGFVNENSFWHAIVREYCYVAHERNGPEHFDESISSIPSSIKSNDNIRGKPSSRKSSER